MVSNLSNEHWPWSQETCAVLHLSDCSLGDLGQFLGLSGPNFPNGQVNIMIPQYCENECDHVG